MSAQRDRIGVNALAWHVTDCGSFSNHIQFPKHHHVCHPKPKYNNNAIIIIIGLEDIITGIKENKNIILILKSHIKKKINLYISLATKKIFLLWGWGCGMGDKEEVVEYTEVKKN